MEGMPRHAPCSKETPSGSGTACDAGTTVYSGRAERPVRLRAVAPDASADPVGGHAFSDEVDVSRTVAVRDHARIRHAVAEGGLSLLDVAGIDAGRGDHSSTARRFADALVAWGCREDRTWHARTPADRLISADSGSLGGRSPFACVGRLSQRLGCQVAQLHGRRRWPARAWTRPASRYSMPICHASVLDF